MLNFPVTRDHIFISFKEVTFGGVFVSLCVNEWNLFVGLEFLAKKSSSIWVSLQYGEYSAVYYCPSTQDCKCWWVIVLKRVLSCLFPDLKAKTRLENERDLGMYLLF